MRRKVFAFSFLCAVRQSGCRRAAFVLRREKNRRARPGKLRFSVIRIQIFVLHRVSTRAFLRLLRLQLFHRPAEKHDKTADRCSHRKKVRNGFKYRSARLRLMYRLNRFFMNNAAHLA